LLNDTKPSYYTEKIERAPFTGKGIKLNGTVIKEDPIHVSDIVLNSVVSLTLGEEKDGFE